MYDSLRKSLPKNSRPTIVDVLLVFNLREKFSPGPGFEPESLALRAGALPTALNPGPGENVSLKLTTWDLPDFFSENKIFLIYYTSFQLSLL